MNCPTLSFDILREQLLALGGARVVEVPEPDLAPLLRRGRTFESIEVVAPDADAAPHMRSRDCHANACRLYEAKPRRIVICTGWALSADGLWRQHSWALRKPYGSKIPNPAIIETTTPRRRYYGVELTSAEARRFVADNLD